MERYVDLHAHTVYSDGSVSPADLVTTAASYGASAVAITDHDTVGGLIEARAAADRAGIEFVDGIEISAEYSPGTMHILGYCIDANSPALKSKIEELQRARARRNPEIVARLQSLGFEMDYDEVLDVAGKEIVGRPHFARLLLAKGYVATMQEAFDKYLAKGAAAYVEKMRLSPGDAIALIHDAGGVAVLAHPYQLRLSLFAEEEALIEELAALGLDGIEAIYSRHSETQRTAYSEMAKRHGLLVTGGSDYHGSFKPDIDLVKGLGDLRVPYLILEAVKDRAAAFAA